MEQYHDINITDIQLHAAIPRKPTPWYRAITKALNGGFFNKESRFYTTRQNKLKNGSMQVSFPLSPEVQKEKERAEKAGKKIRFIFPPEGIPIRLSRDFIEKLKADAKKQKSLNN
jgi:hypothetical protein